MILTKKECKQLFTILSTEFTSNQEIKNAIIRWILDNYVDNVTRELLDKYAPNTMPKNKNETD